MRVANSNAVVPMLIFILASLGSLSAQEGNSKPGGFDGTFRASTLKGMEEAYIPTLYASSHAANLLQLKNGDILCFWFSGEGEGHFNAIVMSRLPKGSRQWSAPVQVAHQNHRSFQNPVAFQLPSGDIWLLHTSQVAGQWQAKAQVQFLVSSDAGNSWSTAKTLFGKPGSFTRQPPVLLSEKHWLLPIYYTPSRSITDGAESNYSAVEVTSDGGRHWKECLIPHSGGLVQQSIVRISQRRFLGFFRSRYADFIYESTSDDGCAWTPPAPTPLPNNNSSIQATRLKGGSVVLVFNDRSAGAVRDKPRTAPRTPLSIALSTDSGKTWPRIRDIEIGLPVGNDDERPKSEEYSYPSVLQDSEGRIEVAYTYCRQTIKVVRIDEDWIKADGTNGAKEKD